MVAKRFERAEKSWGYIYCFGHFCKPKFFVHVQIVFNMKKDTLVANQILRLEISLLRMVENIDNGVFTSRASELKVALVLLGL